jgi:hypothetical protein
MAFTFVKVEMFDLTPELAEDFSKMTPLPGERGLKPQRIAYLLDQICAGMFICPTWAVGVRREDGQRFRLDGQHSSHVLTHLPKGVPFPTGQKVIILTYEFDSIKEDGFGMFNLFNNPRSVRNNIDAIGIYRAQHTDLSAVSRELMSKLLAGVNLYVAKHGGVSTPSRERGLLAEEEIHRQFVLWAAQFDGTKNQNWLSKPGIVEEMYEDFLANREAAEEAWYLTFTESHPEPDHDTRVTAEDFKKMCQRPRGLKTTAFKVRAHKMWTRFLKSYSKPAEGPEDVHSGGGLRVVHPDDEPGGIEIDQPAG